MDFQTERGKRTGESRNQCINFPESADEDSVEVCSSPFADAVNISVTAALNQCNTKILKPYLRALTIVGLRPMYFKIETCHYAEVSCQIYTVFVVVFVLLGYVLQYMSCFRRDRGLGFKQIPSYPDLDSCDESLVFGYILPYLLHFCGYLCAIFTFRSSDDEQLQSLMERVFLCTIHLRDGFMSQRKIMKILRVFVVFIVIWMVLSFVTVYVMLTQTAVEFKWFAATDVRLSVALKVFLVLCTIWHDAIQVTVISNYCLQSQLLTLYLQFLRDKLLQQPNPSTEWMKEIIEFKKLLKFLNGDVSLPVGLFTIVNLSWAISGIFWLFDSYDSMSLQAIGINILNVVLWILIAMVPFIQAARLTNACKRLQSIGHEVRTKPFGYQDTPDYELDSIVLYTSTLKMKAKVYGIPVNGRYLCIFTVALLTCLLVLGQLNYLK